MTPTQPPHQLDISLLGIVTILGANGERMSLGIAGPTLELFAYLLTHSRKAMRRDHLADLLWEGLDADRSRAALNTALWRVRRTIRRLHGVALVSDANVVRIDIDETVRLDTVRVRDVMGAAIAAFSAEEGLPIAVRNELQAALTRCDGDFVDGVTSSWVLVEREAYLNLRLRGWTLLMQDAGMRSLYEDALAHGRRILAVDPFREAVQCEMLWLYMMSGRRAVAIRHYRDYESMLRRELGIAPMAETRAVYDTICADASFARETLKHFLGHAEQPVAPWHLLGAGDRDAYAFNRPSANPGS